MKVLPLSGDYCTVARAMTCTLNVNVCNSYNNLFPLLRAKSSCKPYYEELITKNSLLLSSWKK